MNDLLSLIIPLTLTGLVGAVAWIIRLEIRLTNLVKDNEAQTATLTRLEKAVEDNRAWNREEHEKLFDSRNLTNEAIIKITTIVSNMDTKIDEILRREIARNGHA